MNTETIEYKNYKITVAQDESPENPFENWDCEPPLLAYYDARGGYGFKAYGDVESLADIVRLLPDSCFERGNRVALFKEFLADTFTKREFVQAAKDCSYYAAMYREGFANLLNEKYGSKPEGWSSATEWFEVAEALLKWAAIPCYNGQSNGYCQGDSALVLAIATPAWAQLVGAPAESLEAQCKSAFELYGAWAWGDVYGVSEIHAPGEPDEDGDETEGEELEDGSCWGFYGRDHEASGLLDHARSIIDYHIKEMAEQAVNEPACLI